MKSKDSRMRILEEMMNGVKVIKYNSMEDFFKQRIGDARVDELGKLKNQRWMDILIKYIGNCMVYFCIITATFVYGI